MKQLQRDLTEAGHAARALARSGLPVIRVPEDMPELTRLGFPEDGSSGLGALVRLGLVHPIARGLYEVRDPKGVTRSSFELLLAGRFAGAPHLATGWWALGQARLTNQDVRDVVVLTQTERRDLAVLDRRARAIKVDPDEIWGGEARGSGLVVARPERALCDCAGRRAARIPAARIAEALDAFLNSDPHAIEHLAGAVKRFGSAAVARRLGYLVELIAGEQAARPLFELVGTSHKADALDRGDEASPVVSRWRVRTKLTPEELLEHRRVS